MAAKDYMIAKPVDMAAVPDPPRQTGRSSPLFAVFEQVYDLPRGKALPITFRDVKRGLYVRGQLRKWAKKRGDMLSSSRTADHLTFFFWIEPKK